MRPQEIRTIAGILLKRVVPRDAEEGAAISMLATKLVTDYCPPEQRQPPPPAKQADSTDSTDSTKTNEIPPAIRPVKAAKRAPRAGNRRRT